MDGSTAHKAAIVEIESTLAKPIYLRHIKYLNYRIEQEHRSIKQIIGPILGFKVFRMLQIILTGIETRHMIK